MLRHINSGDVAFENVYVENSETIILLSKHNQPLRAENRFVETVEIIIFFSKLEKPNYINSKFFKSKFRSNFFFFYVPKQYRIGTYENN